MKRHFEDHKEKKRYNPNTTFSHTFVFLLSSKPFLLVLWGALQTLEKNCIEQVLDSDQVRLQTRYHVKKSPLSPPPLPSLPPPLLFSPLSSSSLILVYKYLDEKPSWEVMYFIFVAIFVIDAINKNIVALIITIFWKLKGQKKFCLFSHDFGQLVERFT